MTRHVAVDPGRPGVLEVWAYYRHVRELLRAGDSTEGARSASSGLLGDATGSGLRELVRELEREVTMALVACFEACLRVDFLDRVYRRSKDDVGRAFREMYGRGEGRRARLEDLLDVWRDAGAVRKSYVDDFKNLLDFRNWLAHGRYWVLKSRTFDPEEALRVAEELFHELEERHGFAEYRRSVSSA